MRILVLSWRDIANPRAGGAERVTFQHMRYWVASGHQVTLFTARYPGAAPCGDLDGVHIVRRGNERTVHLAAQHWYRRQTWRPDIVIDEVHGIPFGAVAYAGVPVVGWIYEVAREIWFRMYPFPVAAVGWLAEAGMLRWYASRGSRFVADSRSTAADLMALGATPELLTIIEPAIDRPPLPRLPRKESVPTMIVVGRIVRMKRVADALHTLARVRGQLPEARLWIVGDGPEDYLEELRAISSHLGLDAAVQFLGRVNEDEKYRLLARAHILVHTSVREGWGINIIEANAMATPAVAYHVPGLRDSIAHGRTGLLSPRADTARLASSIHCLLTSPDVYREMQWQALSWSARFTWDVARRRSLELLGLVAGQ